MLCMCRIMKAQTLGDSSHMDFMCGQRILEINPNHPIVQDLNRTSKGAPQSSQSQKMLDLLYETALLSSGYTPESPAEFGAKVYEMMSLALAGKSESTAGEPSTSHAEVVEASEVITENDPWKS
jgi:heat shock protein beta